MTYIVSELPSGLVRYKATEVFTRSTVPSALLDAHHIKKGIWGLLRVLRGRVRYCLDADRREVLVVEAGGAAVIAPEVQHHVELLDDDTAFLVEFHRPVSK